MEIDSDKIKAFYQLSVDKTFSKASISLGISQPALSKKIARLEDELGSSLVIRGARGVQFTQAGLDLLQYYQQKRDLDLEFLNKMTNNNGEKFIGEINIATYSSLGRSILLPSMSKVLRKFPHVRIHFQTKEVRELKNILLSGEASFILSDQEILRENVVNEKIGQEENVHIIPKMKSFPEVFLDHDQYDQTTSDFLKLQGLSVKVPRNYFDDIYGIIDAVALGYGQAIVSKHLLKDARGIRVKKHKKRMISDVYLSYFKRTYYPLAHREIIQVLRDELEDYL